MSRPISIDELKAIQIEILQSVHDFCVANDIHYSLAFGSLLGAIRHKGYIPWDDDIDIMMLRKDYERFVASYHNNIYKVYDYRQDPEYVHPFAKVADTRTLLVEQANMKSIGINIDIFPLDSLYDTREESVAFLKSLTPLKTRFRMKILKPTPKNVWWKRIAIRLSKLLVIHTSLKGISAELNKRISLIANDEAVFLGTPAGTDPYAYGSLYEKELFEEYQLIPFEDRQFFAAKGANKILSNYYGADFMQLPPVEKRMSPHTLNQVFWI